MVLEDLITVDAVKAYAGINDTADDDLIESLVMGYSGWVRAYLGRDLSVADYDIRRSGRGTFALQLPQYPVVDVTLLEIDGRAIPAQPAWGQAGYYFDDTQIALCGFMFTRGIANVRIQFSAGFDPVPPEIAQAVIELVTLRYKLRDKLEWSSQSLANQTISLVQRDMPATVATALAQYRCVAPL